MTDCPPDEDRQSPCCRSVEAVPTESELLDHNDTATRTATTTASAIQPAPARRDGRGGSASKEPNTADGPAPMPAVRCWPRAAASVTGAGSRGGAGWRAATGSAGTPPGPISNARQRGCSMGAVIV